MYNLKKCKKYPWWSVTFSKVEGCSTSTPPWKHQKRCQRLEVVSGFQWVPRALGGLRSCRTGFHFTTMLFSPRKKIKFSITDFFSKCDQICRKLWIWLHLTKKPVMENLIFCTVFNETHVPHMIREISTEKWWLENMSNLKLLFFVKFLFFIKKLWEMFFILSKKLFLFSRHSNFSNFFSSFPNFPD